MSWQTEQAERLAAKHALSPEEQAAEMMAWAAKWQAEAQEKAARAQAKEARMEAARRVPTTAELVDRSRSTAISYGTGRSHQAKHQSPPSPAEQKHQEYQTKRREYRRRQGLTA